MKPDHAPPSLPALLAIVAPQIPSLLAPGRQCGRDCQPVIHVGAQAALCVPGGSCAHPRPFPCTRKKSLMLGQRYTRLEGNAMTDLFPCQLESASLNFCPSLGGTKAPARFTNTPETFSVTLAQNSASTLVWIIMLPGH